MWSGFDQVRATSIEMDPLLTTSGKASTDFVRDVYRMWGPNRAKPGLHPTTSESDRTEPELGRIEF